MSSLHLEMDDTEQESINEELIEFAIRESFQDSYKLPCSLQTNGYERLKISKVFLIKDVQEILNSNIKC